MSLERRVKIIATGSYLPKNAVTSESLDKKFNYEKGYCEAKSGVKVRHFADFNENAAQMGAKAITQALQEANMTMDDIDCIISTSGTMDQAIPCNAVMIKKELNCFRNIPAFDVNSTCVSFLYGLDIASDAIHLKKYKNVILVSSDIASVGLDWNNKESSLLFGDGAAAVILARSSDNEKSRLLACHFENFIEGIELTEIKCGSRNHASKFKNFEDFLPLTLFNMKGKEVYKIAAKTSPAFMEVMYKKAQVGIEDIALMVPHQASGAALKMMMRNLNFPEDKYMYILPYMGNQVAVSMPMAFHIAIKENRIKRGDKVIFFGTGAGFTIGASILVY